MGLIRWICVWLMIAVPGMAQNVEPLSRPNFKHALGLLESEPLVVEGPIGFEALVPSTEDVTARIKRDVEGPLAVVEFAAPGNTFLETVVFTQATVDTGPPMSRAFGVANLLVLRTFGQLKETYPDARIIGFGSVMIGELDAVHAVGAYTHPQLGPTVFRHVGLLQADKRDVLLALINISAPRMPARNDAELEDTYSGWMLRNLTFAQ